MTTLDKLYDEALNITTTSHNDDAWPERKIFYEYKPTSYHFLEQLFELLPFEPKDHLIDFGCGKGRVLFMAAHYSCKNVTGYEIDQERYAILKKNVENYIEKFGAETNFNISKEDAQTIKIDGSANKFFFYSPFHPKIYIKVISNILDSVKKHKRDISIFLYRPDISIIQYLDKIDSLQKEVCVEQVFSSAGKEKVQIPRFVLYCNHSINNSIEARSISF